MGTLLSLAVALVAHADNIPQSVLISPSNNTTIATTTAVFSCSATDDIGLQTATLYFDQFTESSASYREDGSSVNTTYDTEISADTPTTNYGNAASLNIDGQTPHAHALMKFPNIIGTGAGQIPAGAEIVSATLTAECTNIGNTMNAYLLNEDWVEGEATWNNRAAGTPWSNPGADGTTSRSGQAVAWSCATTGFKSFDMTPFVSSWSAGTPNYGVVVTEGGIDGIDLNSSEHATPGSRPQLSVTYRVHSLAPQQSQPLTGTAQTADFTVGLSDQTTYKWNCGITDTVGQEAFAPANFTLNVNTAYNVAPFTPSLIAPQSGATNVAPSPTLEVSVSDPENDALDVTFYGRKSGASSQEDFTLVILPDTQYYSSLNNGIFELQTQWIKDQKDLRNVFFVTHEGDIVNTWNSVAEWNIASNAMATLDPILPYGVIPGNHDLSSTRDTSYYNTYFGPARFAGKSWYAGSYPEGTNDNNYQLLSVGGMDFLFLNLVFCPTTDVLTWADAVVKAHPNHRIIMDTHGFLDELARRNVHSASGGCIGTTNNTQYMWDSIVYPNPDIFLVLSGHVLGESNRTDNNIAGTPVHQILANYQGRTNGGNGWLRIMTFKPSQDIIHVETFSPYLNQYETDANSTFTLDYPMDSFDVVGSVQNVPSGTNASMLWQGLEPVTNYEWYARVTDGSGNSTDSPVWTFSTEGNFPPVSNAGMNQSFNDSDGNGTETAALNGEASTDQDGTIVSYEWRIGSTTIATSSVAAHAFPVGTTTVTLTVTDNEGASANDTLVIVVNPNALPIARAGNDQSVSDADSNGSETVTLNGSASTDPDGTIVSYEWKEGQTVLGTGPILATTFTTGAHTATLIVTDNAGATSTDAVTVTVTTPAPANSVHIGSISFTSETSVRKSIRSCRVTANVVVRNQNNATVGGATVAGTWSGVVSGNISRQTSTAGTASFRSDWVQNCGTYTFRVNNVTFSGSTYNPAANVETTDSISL